MNSLLYHPHELTRHNEALKEAVQRACKIVFAEPNISGCLKDGPWYRPGPSEHVIITVFQKAGGGKGQTICTIEIDRPKTGAKLHEYTKISATLLDWSQHAGNTRLLGHLQRQCPFLPRIEATVTYDLEEHK